MEATLLFRPPVGPCGRRAVERSVNPDSEALLGGQCEPDDVASGHPQRRIVCRLDQALPTLPTVPNFVSILGVPSLRRR
jgi:hypothetical protein